MIYSQICVNFRILWINRDEKEKGEYTKIKRESWNAPTLAQARLSQKLPEDLAQARSL